MRVAIVHDWFDQVFGGSERTALAMAEVFPKADIFTMIYNDDVFGGQIHPKRLHTSVLDKWPRFLTKRHQLLLPFIPAAIESYDFKGYDLVISSSPAFSKNIITPPETLHLTYCHSPMRFAWDYWPQYLKDNGYGPLRRFLARRMIPRIRQWDLSGVARVDYWLANSQNSAKRIRKYYKQKDVTVLYPPADISGAKPGAKKRDFYVTLATLTPYKKLDLAIEAFNISGHKLVVIGDGPDRGRLQKLAKDNIKFAGRLEDDDKWRLLAAAQGLIFPQVEDFGLAPIEAMAAGTPVIAYAKGGVLETVTAGKTGVFFKQQTPAVINAAVERARKTRFHQSDLTAAAEQFSKPVFMSKFKTYVKEVYRDHARQ